MAMMSDARRILEESRRPRVVIGPGSIDQVGPEISKLGMCRVAVVTDQGLMEAGYGGKVRDSLARSGVDSVIYDAVSEGPTGEDVDRCRTVLHRAGVEGIVAVGGGSVIDTAKGAMFLLAGGGRMQDYQGYGKASGPMPGLVAIPTTAGTGSECQSYALVVDSSTGKKMACGDAGAMPVVSILDPELTLTQPRHVTAQSGLDALGHAVEAAVTRDGSDESRRWAQVSFSLTSCALESVLRNPTDGDARMKMLLGASLAGMAIEASMLGAAHACANPLSAARGTAHGTAVALMLPSVVRFNGQVDVVADQYRELAICAGWSEDSTESRQAVEMIALRIEELRRAADLPGGLEAAGFHREDLESLATEASGQWTAQFNPLPVGARELLQMYRAAW